MRLRHRLCTLALAGTLACSALADTIPVKRTLGAQHGFLLIRSAAGALLGHGEYYESAVGDRVTARLILHFSDGSLDDETSVFTQHNVFQFVSDHHIQHGPFFKNAIDMQVEANGEVTLRSTDKDGKDKVETNHLDLPSDLANGFLYTMLLNVPHDAAPFTAGMVLPTGKGRLVRLGISPDGSQPFTAVLGDRRSANIFRVRIELGGVAGVVAPIIGKQPSDLTLWIAPGEVPVLVRAVAQLSEGGPMVSLEIAGASFSRATK